jgi:membrane-associated protein
MLSIGYWFGNIQFVKDHLEIVFVAIIIMSFMPLIGGILYERFGKRSKRKGPRRRRVGTGPSEE